MEVTMYNTTVLDHFANPRNVGTFTIPDGIGQSGNPVDGDKITIYIKVQHDRIIDIRFKTFGCAAAIAASSMLTVIAMGKSLAEGLKITNDDVADALGGLPSQKLLCSNIAADALHDAINNYLQKKATTFPDTSNDPETKDNEPSNSSEFKSKLTDSDQIQRYLRHIIMPDIGGTGQQKLLETQVLICAPSMTTCDVLMNYLAAAGISTIYCFLENKDGWESGVAHCRDLNPDVSIEWTDALNVTADYNIIIGDFLFSTYMSDLLIESTLNKISPTFISIIDAWQGCINLCDTPKAIKSYLATIESKRHLIDEEKNEYFVYPLGLTLSYAFIGPLLALELIKARLKIGVELEDIFYFDLWNRSPDKAFSFTDSSFHDFNYASSRLNDSLDDFSVLIIGAGGLGCPASLALAKAGIRKISIMDFDRVEISNLNRQILHTTSKIGLLKVDSAMQALHAINPDICVTTYPDAFSRENAIDIIRNHDIIINGLDNLPTRYLLNDACFFEKKPLIEAGALAFYGQITTIVPNSTPCYRCLFPKPDSTPTAKSCSETGVLGPVPGLMSILQAIEAVKLMIGADSGLKGRLLYYDALETSFDIIQFQKNTDCPLCGDHPSIDELGDYSFVCKG
jgi:molybdopterin/thiamine biosynthesis adenylyltransferase/NifU-like protein involved in Fe-S cluster formation